jgi:4'-phosphopantetheinyl transferase EntD
MDHRCTRLVAPFDLTGTVLITAPHDALAASPHPIEAHTAARYAPRRARDFHSARAAARLLLAEFGVPAAVLLPRPDGSVAWPTGIAGSLAHCESAVAAMLAFRSRWPGLGIDIEPVADLPAGVAARVLTDEDREALARQPPTPGLDRAVFSVKECVHKALFPATGIHLDFCEVSVSWHSGGAVRVHPMTASAARAMRGAELHGGVLRHNNHWIAMLGSRLHCA